MQLDTIEMSKDEARQRLAEYTESLQHDRNTEDERIARAYRYAAKGQPIIRLSEAVHAGGYFDNGLPRIAVARADALGCWVYTDSAGWGRTVYVFTGDPQVTNRGALVGKDSVRVTVPRDDRTSLSRWRRVSTVVPPVPPRFRPKGRRLRWFHVLWEVEKWDPTPPKDPALLRWIGGDLWAVVAVWDLTELERAVLAGGR